MIDENQFSSKLFCQEHIFNLVHVYCVECSQLICDKCLLQQHLNHRNSSLGVISHSNLDELSSSFVSSISSILNTKLPDFLGGLQAKQKMMMEYQENQSTKIDYLAKTIIISVDRISSSIKRYLSDMITEYLEQQTQTKYIYEEIQEELKNSKQFLCLTIFNSEERNYQNWKS